MQLSTTGGGSVERDTNDAGAADVAPELGVTARSVYQLITAGLLPSVRIGHAIRILRAAWKLWLREADTTAMAAAGMKLTGEVARGADGGGGYG